MNRRGILRLAGSIGGLTAVGATPALANGRGQNRSNKRRSDSERLDVSPGDIEEVQTDPEADNFEEEFTYWVVRDIPEYDSAVWRGPARTGPENIELGGSDVGSFWVGVSAPDEDGIQHEVDHRGQESLYLHVGDDTYELRFQFDGRGTLRNVNGVEPE